MLGVGDSIHLIADSSMVSSSCFQKYRETSNNVTELSATNVTLANQQADTVQVQFGSSFYITDENGTISTAAVNEPDILGVSVNLFCVGSFDVVQKETLFFFSLSLPGFFCMFCNLKKFIIVFFFNSALHGLVIMLHFITLNLWPMKLSPILLVIMIV